MSYVAIKSFMTKRGNFIPMGKRVGWLYLKLLRVQDQANFVSEEFYDHPEKQYSRDVERFSKKVVAPASDFLPSARDYIPPVPDDDIPTLGRYRDHTFHDPWDHHPHETFHDHSSIEVPLGAITTLDGVVPVLQMVPDVDSTGDTPYMDSTPDPDPDPNNDYSPPSNNDDDSGLSDPDWDSSGSSSDSSSDSSSSD